MFLLNSLHGLAALPAKQQVLFDPLDVVNRRHLRLIEKQLVRCGMAERFLHNMSAIPS
jgi:hypothetical protein